MTKYKITYLKESDIEEDMSLADWGNPAAIPKEYLESKIVEYKGEPLDDDWQEYQCEVLDIQGDIVDWKEAQENLQVDRSQKCATIIETIKEK